MDELPKCPANYVPLSPVTFLERAAAVYADRTSIIYGRKRFTWKQTHERCRRLASAIRALNISKNDVVSPYMHTYIYLYIYIFMEILIKSNR